MAEKLNIIIFPSDDHRQAMVVIPSDPPFRSTMSTETVDQLIATLGLCRIGLLPEIPQDWQNGQAVECLRDPAINAEDDRLAGDLLLHMRHERFGWLHFVLSRDYARRVVAGLAKRLDTPPPRAEGSA